MIKQLLSSFTGQIFAVLVGLAIVSACTMDAKSSTSTLSLADTQWTLKILSDTMVTNERPLTIAFDKNRLNGFAGCNRFSANYTGSQDGVFSIGPISATKMACGGSRDQLEQRYLEQLSKVTQYAIILDQLQLLDHNRKMLMTFSAMKKIPA